MVAKLNVSAKLAKKLSIPEKLGMAAAKLDGLATFAKHATFAEFGKFGWRSREELLFCSAAYLLAALTVGCGSAETATAGTSVDSTCPAITEDTTVPIEPPPDGAAACAAGDCNYQTQEGCEQGQACRPQFDSIEPNVRPGCEPAGEGASGDDCAAQADCARGYYCAAGTCHKLCCGADWTACDAGESCFRSLEVRAGGQVIPAEAGLCFPTGNCDPLTNTGCEGDVDRECKIVDPTGAVACAPRSEAGAGDDCAPPTVCKAGLNCVGGTCVKLCAFAACGEPACGPDDGACVHFRRDPEGVGECTIDR